MPTRSQSQHWTYLYALFSGLLGMIILLRLFACQAMPVDLPTLLVFSSLSLIVAYFAVPLSGQAVELGFDGPLLLGAALIGGPAFGGWTAFITGLAAAIKPTNLFAAPFQPPIAQAVLPAPLLTPASLIYRRREVRGVDRAAAALLASGRNVMAVSLAWWAYAGVGGKTAPAAVDTSLALALIVFFVIYALLRCLWLLPLRILQSPAPRQVWAAMVEPATLAIELAPLPTAFLIATTYLQLGWSSFLVLALVFTGVGAVMQQMHQEINRASRQIDVLNLALQVQQAVLYAPLQVSELCALAYRLCAQSVPLAKFEMGLYESALGSEIDPTPGAYAIDHVHLQVATDGATVMPPMRIPLTPLWSWLSEQRAPLLVESREQLEALPFDLPPLEQKHPPQSAILIPLLRLPLASPGQPQAADGEPDAPLPPALGGIVIQSPHKNAYQAQDAQHIAVIAGQISLAIQKAQSHAP
jgi:hypothetical protein